MCGCIVTTDVINLEPRLSQVGCNEATNNKKKKKDVGLKEGPVNSKVHLQSPYTQRQGCTYSFCPLHIECMYIYICIIYIYICKM